MISITFTWEPRKVYLFELKLMRFLTIKTMKVKIKY